ncbi:MAG TPA: hypothetical protein VKU82_14675, partial [Planctomycetaceae bacterium]|nr:hypothetical protein [Planctomycetaceae bacterium]
YTHAAIWVLLATAARGDGGRAFELFHLLNPINHTRAPADVERYKVEPYVLAGDVYGAPPHVGRGGWTWYTGSAGWMYRVAVESILGIVLSGDRLKIAPSIPADWPEYTVVLRRGAATWRILVKNRRRIETGAGRVVSIDGRPAPGNEIQLADDGQEHFVEVELDPHNSDSRAGDTVMTSLSGPHSTSRLLGSPDDARR